MKMQFSDYVFAAVTALLAASAVWGGAELIRQGPQDYVVTVVRPDGGIEMKKQITTWGVPSVSIGWGWQTVVPQAGVVAPAGWMVTVEEVKQ